MTDLQPGTRLRLDYDDHNELFAEQLPRDVTVIARVSARHGVDNWYVVSLGDPVEWAGTEYRRLVIRSRWKGHPLGGPSGTSVFILLLPDGEFPADGFDPHEYFHVAWGFASRVPAVN